MGVSYAAIDRWITRGEGEEKDLAVIRRFHERSEHKRKPIPTYKETGHSEERSDEES